MHGATMMISTMYVISKLTTVFIYNTVFFVYFVKYTPIQSTIGS